MDLQAKLNLVKIMLDIMEKFFSDRNRETSAQEKLNALAGESRLPMTSSGLAICMRHNQPFLLSGPWGSLVFPPTGRFTMDLVRFMSRFALLPVPEEAKLHCGITYPNEMFALISFEDQQLPEIDWPIPTVDDLEVERSLALEWKNLRDHVLHVIRTRTVR